jgi:hypothetical protein
MTAVQGYVKDKCVITDSGLSVPDGTRVLVTILDNVISSVSDVNSFEWADTNIQERAILAVKNMRAVAAQNGYMTEDEINAEIQAYRNEKRGAAV